MGIGLADVLVKGKLPRGRAWFVGIGHGEGDCLCDMVDDEEMLELVEMDMRELLSICLAPSTNFGSKKD